MPLPRLASLPARIWIILAMFMAGLGALGLSQSRSLSSNRVLILAPALESLGRDVGPGLETLMSDLLEVMAGATVSHATALPSPSDLQHLPPNLWVLRFRGQRDGDRLALSVEWNTVARLLSDQPWFLDITTAQEPRKTLEQVVKHWPLPLRHRAFDALIPKTSDHFWLLLEGLSIREDRRAIEHLPISQQLAEDEPDCATAWTTFGDHLYRSVWVDPTLAGIGLSSRTHRAFQKAVERVPGHPRATFLWSLMLTDTGNQGVALHSLQEAIRLRPNSPDLLLGVAYAGRTSGLLETARRALARRQQLMGPLASPSAWFMETTYLYLEDWEAFDREIERAGTLRQNANILFYQGYSALLQGRRSQALGFMQAGSDPSMEPTPFRDLCRVYRAYLEDRPQEGLAELRLIDEFRGKLRIPDGEWTFKEAEAYSLLGDADRGMDCATRAFVQGFSCARWYEISPFLERVRQHPRWPMLRRNIRERQTVMEGSFPPSAF